MGKEMDIDSLSSCIDEQQSMAWVEGLDIDQWLVALLLT